MTDFMQAGEVRVAFERQGQGPALVLMHGAEASRQMFATLAGEYSLAFVPFLLDQVALKPELMQADGIHANAAGQPKILANLWPELKPLLVAPGKPAS